MGPRLGHRRRASPTAANAIARALGAQDDRHLLERREAGTRPRRTSRSNHATGDVVEAVKAATDGRGADVVVETRRRGDVAAHRSRRRGTGGRITVCGATSGPNPPAALHRIWWKQLTIYGSTMGTKEDFDGVYELVTSGRAKPVVDEVFPLSEARAAHERMEAGDQLGKIVLTIPG